MSLHEKIIEEWRVDAEMNDDLFEEARRIPILHAKWLDKYLRVQLLKEEKDLNYKIKYREIYNYYMGRDESAPEDRILKSEVSIYVDSDPSVTEAKASLKYYEKLESVLKEILNNINNRSFQIKNAIDWKKYAKGLDD
jgi:hypothetical protein